MSGTDLPLLNFPTECNYLPEESVKRAVQKSLSRSNLFALTFLYPHIIQKSYGSEKRFICPPPTVILDGDVWRRKDGSGQINRMCDIRVHINAINEEMHTLRLFKEKYYIAKAIHSCDLNSYRRTKLTINMHHKAGGRIGIFRSNPIHVISKPTIKRYPNNDSLIIRSGTSVSIFNRVRSQATNTMFLFIEKGEFIASSDLWTPFSIYLISDEEKDSERCLCEPGVIQSGSKVMLVHEPTKSSLPHMFIEKVGKDGIKMECNEQVSQLHRYAFRFVDQPKSYLCCSRDGTVYSSNGFYEKEDKKIFDDPACWTIVSVEQNDYRWFFEGRSVDVTPVPIVKSAVRITSSADIRLVDIYGENFLPIHTVWFGHLKGHTVYRCSEHIAATAPPASKFGVSCKQGFTVPITIARNDGVIYPTDAKYIYDPVLRE